ncbi:MAG: sigma 54-interacting transcriptional regulator [Proteobacteria bacterium]|nr:sigma 54-interacting transcriptional regulator [Pseudomonadota bacterium]MBU1741354.1 sigma 54-interacting transcriptional regulator [Pseudomonadota bacterium]
MTINHNEFFRQATLRICGRLGMDKALHDAFTHIRQFIPAEAMHLYIYDAGSGVLKTVASADAEGGRTLEVQTGLPAAARQRLESEGVPYVWIINDMAEDEIGALVADSLNLTGSSGLVMMLRLEGEDLGAVFVSAPGRDQFTEEHGRLLSTLNEPFAVALSNCLRFAEVSRLRELLDDDYQYLQEELRRMAGDQIIGDDFGLKGVMELVRQVAPLNSPVLLLGETGTGKELIAVAIHNWSPRRDGPFIKVNCGAIPATIMDSELFGHEKGAFTGAHALKRGRFERADGGTIFLDEIGELSPEAQIRLLRVLQEKEIERVGGTRPIKTDLRVIAATHRNLEAMVREGRFREDLYFRLRVFPIVIPPLRERLADIPVLVHHFIQKKSRELGLPVVSTLAPGAIDRLMDYHWPGNVRELENAVERAIILSQGKPLTWHDLVPIGRPAESEGHLDEDLDLTLDEVNARHIRRVLAKTGGRIEGDKGAAHMLGLNPATLRNRMKKLGIPFGRKAAP